MDPWLWIHSLCCITNRPLTSLTIWRERTPLAESSALEFGENNINLDILLSEVNPNTHCIWVNKVKRHRKWSRTVIKSLVLCFFTLLQTCGCCWRQLLPEVCQFPYENRVVLMRLMMLMTLKCDFFLQGFPTLRSLIELHVNLMSLHCKMLKLR